MKTEVAVFNQEKPFARFVSSSSISPVQAVWSRGDGAAVDPRHKRTEGVLHIRGAKREDAGQYVCQVTNHSRGHGHVTSCSPLIGPCGS